jgi:hypothetical protein
VKEGTRYAVGPGTMVTFDVQLTWHSTFQASMLDVGCLGGSTNRVSGQDGSTQVNAAGSLDVNNQVQIQCRASRPANFVEEIASTGLLVNVGTDKNVELLPPTPTFTETPTATLTPSPTVTLTPTIDKTQNAMETEGAAEKTAEFVSTITAIARQTEQATQASVITLNGTFGLSEPGSSCSASTYSSGTLNITANFGAGSANGTLTGGGTSSHTGLLCNGLKYDVSCTQSYTGSYSGGLDPVSGVVSLSGSVSGNQSCTFSNCSQDGVEVACGNQSDSINNPLTITGTILKDSGTGNGSLQTCAGCTGSWTAGK